MNGYEEEYNKLNPAQRKAVESIEGPLLVIAGPGTGKTQLLSFRVANILKSTDTNPELILCLTFTNKAAINMRKRLTGLIGPQGNRVKVRTFHSFASDILADYSEYFWNGARLTHVPDPVQLEIVSGILSELPLDNPLALKFAGKFTSLVDVQEGLKLAKEAGLTPDKLRALIRLNLSYIDQIEPLMVDICSDRLSYKKIDQIEEKVQQLPPLESDQATRPLISLSTVISESFYTAKSLDEGSKKTKNLSKWKSRWVGAVDGEKSMNSERRRNEWWLALADVYESYRTLLHKRGYYDYADMIIEVNSQLESIPELRASVQEKISYVLIDEFQDTNAAQLRLAHLVADHYLAEGRPNIMAVGDDDQAIYKFQGAELSNIRDFLRSYKDVQSVVLTDNYRSSREVLELSEKIISQSTSRAVDIDKNLEKKLTPRSESSQSGRIRHISLPTKEQLYLEVAKQAGSEFEKSGNHIAILARSHESLKNLAALMKKMDIPVFYEQQQSITTQPAVKEALTVANAVQAIADGDRAQANQHISRLLAHDMWEVAPENLWEMALASKKSRDWIDTLLKSDNPRIQSIGHWLLWLARESKVQPLPRMMEYIIGLTASEHLTSPLRNYFLANQAIDTPYISSISGTNRLLSIAEQASRQGQAQLVDLLKIVQASEDNQKNIYDESLFASAGKSIELMTVHKAKGLEFDSVYIVDAQENIWQPNPGGRKAPANLPLKPAGDDLDDYIRLFFVAVSRTKHSITIASYNTNETGEEVLPSGIIRDILPAVAVDNDDLSPELDALEHHIRWPRLEGSKEKLLLRETVANFSLSATAFLDFLDVTKGGPQYFLERHLLRLPEAQSSQTAFGSAMHAALEYAQVLVCDNAFELGQVQNQYETALFEKFLDDKEHERYLIHGQKLLDRLFNDFKLVLRDDGRPEVALQDITINEARLQGKLDRVDIVDNTVEITDYKTGAPLSNLFTKNKSYELKAWRHRTQLEFYILLAQNSFLLKDKKSYRGHMLYAETDLAKHLIKTYTPDQQRIDRLALLIQKIWNKIMDTEFPDTRHYDTSLKGVTAFENDLLDSKI